MSNTEPGNINENGQMTIAKTTWAGNSPKQKIYVLECQKCGFRYGANGADIFERKCPNCQAGKGCSYSECPAEKVGDKGNCEPCRAYQGPISASQTTRLDDAIRLLEAGDWQAAHAIVQSDASRLGNWAHGIAHLLGGDRDNARYWYRRIDRELSDPTAIDAEIAALKLESKA